MGRGGAWIVTVAMVALVVGCATPGPDVTERARGGEDVETLARNAFVNVCVMATAAKVSPNDVVTAYAELQARRQERFSDYQLYDSLDDDTASFVNSPDFMFDQMSRAIRLAQFDLVKPRTAADIRPKTWRMPATNGLVEIVTGDDPAYWCTVRMFGGSPERALAMTRSYFEGMPEPFAFDAVRDPDPAITAHSGFVDISDEDFASVVMGFASRATQDETTPGFAMTSWPAAEED